MIENTSAFSRREVEMINCPSCGLQHSSYYSVILNTNLVEVFCENNKQYLVVRR